LRNWVALTRYAEDGRLKIHNRRAEQALRPIVFGRKNWLFAGSEAAAHRTAILCSLVQTCKHLRINPFVYLRDVIERVSTHPARLVLELTPRQWKRLRQDSGAQAAASTGPRSDPGVPCPDRCSPKTGPAYSSSSNALASLRSAVSKPSVNQP
jgi:hypothetical protein